MATSKENGWLLPVDCKPNDFAYHYVPDRKVKIVFGSGEFIDSNGLINTAYGITDDRCVFDAKNPERKVD